MVEWSIPARDDLRQIYDYIARDSKYYAEKVVITIIEQTETLEIFPEMGRIVPEIGENTIREIFVYSYRVIYEVFPEKIEILSLIHGKRDFSENF